MPRRPAAVTAILVITSAVGCQQTPPLAVASPTVLGSLTSTPTSIVVAGTPTVLAAPTAIATPPPSPAPPISDPLAIEAMGARSYPGSDITIEETLSGGSGYNRYLASYQSDGLKLFGLLTVPTGNRPSGGWPVILLNHGYIPPPEYSTEQSYAGIVAPLAAAGYIVFKPDYRGNGQSAGAPLQPYVSPEYVTDSLNALASLKRYPDANPDKIGVWGHSMGGNIALHELVLAGDFKAAVLMAGVVGSYSDILDWWTVRLTTGVLTTQNDLETHQQLLQMVNLHGTPQTDPGYWNAIDPTAYISDIQAPVLIQVGTADGIVPPKFSQGLAASLQRSGKAVTLHTYPGADHNLSPYTAAAMAEAVTFFDQYLK